MWGGRGSNPRPTDYEGAVSAEWDSTAFNDLWCQTVVIETGTTEYTTESCRGLMGLGETPADWVRTEEPTAYRTAARPFIDSLFDPRGCVCK